jgi:formyl-CoA transferase
MIELSAQQPTDEFVKRAQSFDVPAASVVTLADLPQQPQIVNNQVFIEREHPTAGRIREPRPAARFSATPTQAGRLAPSPGQHSDEVVAEVGLDAAALRAAGVIF